MAGKLVSNIDELIPLMETGEVQRARMSGQVSYSLQSAVIEHYRELIAFVGIPVPIVHSSVRHAGRPLDALLLLSTAPPPAKRQDTGVTAG
jgi:hypothetical protein